MKNQNKKLYFTFSKVLWITKTVYLHFWKIIPTTLGTELNKLRQISLASEIMKTLQSLCLSKKTLSGHSTVFFTHFSRCWTGWLLTICCISIYSNLKYIWNMSLIKTPHQVLNVCWQTFTSFWVSKEGLLTLLWSPDCSWLGLSKWSVKKMLSCILLVLLLVSLLKAQLVGLCWLQENTVGYRTIV